MQLLGIYWMWGKENLEWNLGFSLPQSKRDAQAFESECATNHNQLTEGLLIMAKAKISQVKYLFQAYVYAQTHFFNGQLDTSSLVADIK